MESLFSIICKTHLHAGSGDSNYGVIDKLVQRDPTSNLPCIYASSLKGACREYWIEKLGKEAEAKKIFGDSDKGAVIFNQAAIISLPARSNLLPYFNVTAPLAIEAIVEQNDFLTTKSDVSELLKLKALKQDGKIIVFGNYGENLCIENYEWPNVVINTNNIVTDKLKSWFGNNIAIVDDAAFLELCSDYNLPVIARNHLENGQSNNLWYEQIVPRESRFSFAVITTPGKDADANLFFNTLEDVQLVQIGANATIGYGQCLINKAI